MKLSKLRHNPSIEIELTNAPGLFVTLASRDSSEVKKVTEKLVDRRLSMMKKGRTPTASDLEADTKATLTAAILALRDETGDGDPMVFSPETVAELVEIPWVRRQLDDALGNDQLFFEN